MLIQNDGNLSCAKMNKAKCSIALYFIFIQYNAQIAIEKR